MVRVPHGSSRRRRLRAALQWPERYAPLIDKCQAVAGRGWPRDHSVAKKVLTSANWLCKAKKRSQAGSLVMSGPRTRRPSWASRSPTLHANVAEQPVPSHTLGRKAAGQKTTLAAFRRILGALVSAARLCPVSRRSVFTQYRGTGERWRRRRPTVRNTVGPAAVQLPSDYARRPQKTADYKRTRENRNKPGLGRFCRENMTISGRY